jgi:hypothetical protein
MLTHANNPWIFRARPYDYDASGDGLHGYNVVKNDHGKIVFIKHMAFQPK